MRVPLVDRLPHYGGGDEDDRDPEGGRHRSLCGFLDLPDPDQLVRGTDPDLDPFIIKQK
jgi:hypothetical protein